MFLKLDTICFHIKNAPYNTVHININAISVIEKITAIHQEFYKKNKYHPEVIENNKFLPEELPQNGAVIYLVGNVTTPLYTVTPYKKIIETVASLTTIKEIE